MTFLGMLLNGRNKMISIPIEKKNKAVQLLKWVIGSRKITVNIVQKLTGTLNFLNRALVPGRTFTRMMYNKLKIRDHQGNMLKSYHHVTVEKEFRLDCEIWMSFLNSSDSRRLCRPFIDL